MTPVLGGKFCCAIDKDSGYLSLLVVLWGYWCGSLYEVLVLVTRWYRSYANILYFRVSACSIGAVSVHIAAK